MAYNPPQPFDAGATTGDSIMFPSDLFANGERPYMLFQFMEWSRNTILTGGNLNPASSVLVLPMAKRLAEAQRSVWSQSEDFFLGVQGMASGGMGIADIVKSLLARGITGTDVGSALTGAVANPWMTMLYRAPDLKRHSFTWNFVPCNEDESKKLLQVVNIFRKHMLPKMGSNSAVLPGGPGFLSYPDVLLIAYGPANVKNYFNKFKVCVVESVEIDRSAGGVPSVFTSGAPAVVGLNVNVVELQIWTQTDISDNGADTGGTGLSMV